MRSAPDLHRPTRDDLLKVAPGFWQRARINFKWFTIKSFRKFNADDMSAFITWFLMSQTLWIFVGTTTFFSVMFSLANSLRLQKYVATAISDYLTEGTDIVIVFESAIVPQWKWKDSRISFKNVYVSRRPSTTVAQKAKAKAKARRRKQEHQGAIGYDVSDHPANHPIEDDYNYTMFDLNIDSIDVKLSLARFWEGKGLVENAVVRGVRGVLDRRTVFYDPENPLDPADFRHTHMPGDFELGSLQLEDVLVTVYQPGGFRPYAASIFRADIRTFRKRWLFYDFLLAESIVGQFDNCLFSLHKPQSISRSMEMDTQDGEWARMSRIRIDGVNIDHLSRSTTGEGPMSWITSGKVDAVLDIKFPHDPKDDRPFEALLEDLADAISEHIPGQRELTKPPLTVPEDQEETSSVSEPKIVIDIDLRFRDVKAAVPLFTSDLSYVNNALIRPIVAFVNANRTLVPIHCRVVKNLSEFDGSWTVRGLMDDISEKIYDALAYHVIQANMNQRIKTVSLWSLQKTAGAMLLAIKRVVDPLSEHMRESYEKGQAMYDTVQFAPAL
ncbi:mitochondrial distribution and morphology protein family 31/32 [Fistulina hepatica ATCC 64428]|uniref:Mitochondrial distribution and morphology protein family 31/32 n=1 Tax=Fistulina hepatica ATCC 64428 TaxID=1128425 RepID=A0A0D7ARL4_9AGAR|nr:mitochondrial distribution and morphology protein family 31/32 [Fistulina hepatica ATCC 64428]